MGFGFLESVYEKCMLIELRKAGLDTESQQPIAHEVQLVNYLVATGKPVGLLINFGETRAEVKRKVKDLP
jgi:hypothetical protein